MNTAQKTIAKKKNMVFCWFYFLLILMVVDCHTGGSLNILTGVFPYDSFFMPAFFFCSGYFFSRRPVFEAITHKAKRILLPYVIFNVFFLITSKIVDIAIGTQWFIKPTGGGLLESLIGDPLSSLNGAAWFCASLFLVQVAYIFIERIIHDKTSFERLTSIVLVALGIGAIYFSMNNIDFGHYCVRYIYRAIFYLQFYHFGVMFRKYNEKKISDKVLPLIMGGAGAINIVIILLFGSEMIIFPSTSEMAGFRNMVLPLITSITGIAFYYSLSRILSKKIGNNRFVEFVGSNTFWIMELHILFANVPNIIIYLIRKSDSSAFAGFNDAGFISMAWVQVYPRIQLLYFASAFSLSLLSIYCRDRSKAFLGKHSCLRLKAN